MIVAKYFLLMPNYGHVIHVILRSRRCEKVHDNATDFRINIMENVGRICYSLISKIKQLIIQRNVKRSVIKEYS